MCLVKSLWIKCLKWTTCLYRARSYKNGQERRELEKCILSLHKFKCCVCVCFITVGFLEHLFQSFEHQSFIHLHCILNNGYIKTSAEQNLSRWIHNSGVKNNLIKHTVCVLYCRNIQISLYFLKVLIRESKLHISNYFLKNHIKSQFAFLQCMFKKHLIRWCFMSET